MNEDEWRAFAEPCMFCGEPGDILHFDSGMRWWECRACHELPYEIERER